MNQKDIDRLYLAIDELRKLMLQRFEHTDRSVSELRQHTDLGLSELRQHTDSSIAELRAHVDKRLDDVRRDVRWVMAMWLTTVGLIVSIGGRVFGYY